MTVHDEALAARAKTALAMDRRTSGLPINVRASNGEVFLKGKVDALEQIEVAQFILSGIPGVRHVDVQELQVKERSE
ncbi:MAG TPA: BON domain-containing protein [Armatimonadota bacterium]|nr:BON domain-containing protein [Armatimonadota bacterium]